MGIARHDSGTVFLSPLKERLHQKDQSFDKIQTLIPKIKTHVEDNLVVSTSTRMDLSSGFNANSFNEIALDVGMDIFFRRIQSKLSLLMKRFYFPQSLEDFLSILFREDGLPTKHEDVGSISPEIIRDQPLIARRNPFDISPRKKINHLLGGEFLKPPSP
jgi:hypothetical protein